jgi:hypothetical protein
MGAFSLCQDTRSGAAFIVGEGRYGAWAVCAGEESCKKVCAAGEDIRASSVVSDYGDALLGGRLVFIC